MISTKITPIGERQSTSGNIMEFGSKGSSTDLKTKAERPDLSPRSKADRSARKRISNRKSGRSESPEQSGDPKRLDELIRSTPDVRVARVNQVRSQIEKGTYHVKAEKIADKMISDSMVPKPNSCDSSDDCA